MGRTPGLKYKTWGARPEAVKDRMPEVTLPWGQTLTRWVAPTTVMLATLLSYIDRQVLAVLAPLILSDTGLSANQYANAMSAFSLFYMLGNPLWGSLLDFAGLRVGMLMAVGLWTMASASHAWVGGALGFMVARAVLGFGEGGAFPGAFRTATESLPVTQVSRGMALGYSGASLGALITPFLVLPVAQGWIRWQTAFLFTGALGVAWLVLWFFVARPPFLRAHAQRATRISLPNLLDRRFWVVGASFGLGAVALGIVAYLSPLYLSRALGLSQAEIAKVVWIPMVGWEAGYFFWGWIADKYLREMPDRVKPARIFVLLTVLALPSLFVTQTTSLPIVLALFFWATFVADGFVVTSLRVGMRIFPADRTGMVAGIGSGSWSAVQALVLPIYGSWVDLRWFGMIFLTMSLLPIVGTTLWFWLSRKRELWTATP
jgi:MFS transporter, ACS family, hexuronate transporter